MTDAHQAAPLSDTAAAPLEVPDSGGRHDPPEPAVIDLLGVLAYGELSAFDRMAADARWAPTLAGRVSLSQMATAEMGHFRSLARHLEARGVAVEDAMKPFIAPFDAFHDSTAPHSWLESLVKAHVGDGLAADFYREIAAYLDSATRDLVIASLEDTGQADFVVERIRRAIADQPSIGGRLALWGRRLMGEALTQAQRVAAERDALSALLAGGIDRPGLDLAAIGRMFTRITDRHAERMAELGLSS